MSSRVQYLTKQGLINPPHFVVSNIMYETIMGSVAYGVSNDMSDVDVYGFCIPPKEILFPHLAGEIFGFGRQHQRFEQYQQHHVADPGSEREYDITIYSIVKFVQLVMENNPNMVDALFTPRRCVLHTTRVAEILRENRRVFLHKGAWPKFKGYAYAQMSKIEGGQNRSNPKRAESIETWGYDVKFAYHVVRLLGEVEQIMVEHDLDLERNREQLKAIRRGEWTLEYLREWFQQREKELEGVYSESTLQHGPDETRIKELLVQCLEEHYGSLSKAGALIQEGKLDKMIAEMQGVIDRYR